MSDNMLGYGTVFYLCSFVTSPSPVFTRKITLCFRGFLEEYYQ